MDLREVTTAGEGRPDGAAHTGSRDKTTFGTSTVVVCTDSFVVTAIVGFRHDETKLLELKVSCVCPSVGEVIECEATEGMSCHHMGFGTRLPPGMVNITGRSREGSGTTSFHGVSRFLLMS